MHLIYHKSLKKDVLMFHQRGAALIFMMFIIGLGATAYFLTSVKVSNLEVQQSKKNSQILDDAKYALISYSVNIVGGGTRPGDMPLPDRLLSPTESPPAGGPPNYDGVSDSCVGTAATLTCLGRLPWKTIGMAIRDPSQADILGDMPWYAVSGNLVDPTCMKVINPSVLSMVYTNYQCNSNTNLPHPWLTVKDAAGNIISDRVAAVLLLPDHILNGQTRQDNPLSDANHYLEAGNNELDHEFVLKLKSDTFNDRLVYITIDELLAAVGQRAASEVSSLLNKYKSQAGFYPMAAPLGSTQGNFITDTEVAGMLPIDGINYGICSTVPLPRCNVYLKTLANATFTKASAGDWTATTGACSMAARKCTCTGTGRCARGTDIVDCNFESGFCVYNKPYTVGDSFSFTVADYENIPYAEPPVCSIVGSKVTCNGSGTFRIGLKVPQWFTDNDWQHYFYFESDSTNNLKIGSRAGLSAILINVGDKTTSELGSVQVRPSADLGDYLDSTENTNMNGAFESATKNHTSNYNDQPFIISP